MKVFLQAHFGCSGGCAGLRGWGSGWGAGEEEGGAGDLLLGHRQEPHQRRDDRSDLTKMSEKIFKYYLVRWSKISPQQTRSGSMKCRLHRSRHQKRQLSFHHITKFTIHCTLTEIGLNLNCRHFSWTTMVNSHLLPLRPPDTKSRKISFFSYWALLGKHCIACFQNVKLTTIHACKLVISARMMLNISILCRS